jgi:hypothetical protein
MRMARFLLWGVLGSGLAGCSSTRNEIEPPPPSEEYVSPPASDPRYNGPPKYPKEIMQQPALIQKKDTLNGLPPQQGQGFGPGPTR